MKSEEQQRIIYDAQKQVFEGKRAIQLQNIDSNIEQLEEKLTSLKLHLEKLHRDRKKIEEKVFPDFPSYLQSIKEKSNKARNKNGQETSN